MPDFNKVIQNLKAQRKENFVDPADTSEEANNARKVRNSNLSKELADKYSGKPKFTGDSDSIKNANNPDYIQSKARENYAQQYAPDTNYNSYQPYTDPNAKGVSYLYEDFASKVGKSLATGVGEVVKGWGDVLQFATSLGYTTGDGWDDNPLQALGQFIQDENSLETNTDFGNEELSLGDLLVNPEFWTTQAPKVIPQIADMLLVGRGAGKGVQLAEKGLAKTLTKEVVEEGAEGLAKKFASNSGKSLRATTKGVYEGAEKVNEYAGTGASRLSRVFTDQGKFTKTFNEIANSTASGILVNAKVGMQNGTEMYNTYSNLTDKDGNKLFTKQESAEMARNTMLNNLAYAAIDIASYGLIFGKTKALGSAIRGSEKTLLSNTAKMFAESQKYLPGRLAQLGGKMAFEGVEEAFQESFEEWSKIKAYHDARGSLKGYQGKIPANLQGKDLSLWGDFFTFFNSDENKTTRNLSGALGALMGGAMDIKNVMNKSADDAYNMYSRVENMNRRFEKGTEGAEYRDYHVRGIMNEMIMENKEDAFVDYLNRLRDKGTVTQEEYDYYGQVFDQMANKANDIRSIKSLSGQVSYMTNFGEEMAYMDKLEVARNKYEENVAFHKENIKDPNDLKRVLKKEFKAFSETADNLSKLVVVAQENQQQLLAGRPAQLLETRTIPSGTESSIALNENKTFKGASADYVRAYKRNAKIKFNEFLNSIGMNEDQAEQATNFGEDSVQENQSSLDSISQKLMNGVGSAYAKLKGVVDSNSTIGNFVTQAGNKLANIFEETKNGIQARKLVNRNEELSQEAFDKFVENGDVSPAVLNNIAQKIANGEQLTEQEQAVRQEKSAEIESILNSKKEESSFIEPTNDKEMYDRIIGINNKVNENGFESMTDEEMDFYDKNYDTVNEVVKNEALLQEAVSQLSQGNELDDDLYNVVSKNPERFAELAEAKGIKNYEELLSKSLTDNNDELTDGESKFIDEASKRNSNKNQKDKDQKELNKKRKASEFNENNDNPLDQKNQQQEKTKEKKSKEQLKKELKEKIDNLPDDLVYLVHQTHEDTSKSIYDDGFRLQGPAVESTFLQMSKNTMNDVMSGFLDGVTMHRNSTGAFIYGVPKSFFGSQKLTAANVLDALMENGYMTDGKMTLPSEFNVGYFTEGELFTKFSNENNNDNNLNPDARYSLEENSETETQTQEQKENKIKSAVKSFAKVARDSYNRFQESSRNGINSASNTISDMNPLRYDHRKLSQMVTVDDKLSEMYPNSNINVVVVNDLKRIIGVPALGMALHGTIYIDEKAWKSNNKTFFHEIAHINFALSKNETATKELVQELLKNKPLVNDILSRYDNQLQYDVIDNGRGQSLEPGTVVKTKGQLLNSIQKQLNKKLSREEADSVLDQLERDGKIKTRPLEQQEIIVDELFAHNMELSMNDNLKNIYFEEKTAQEIALEDDIRNGVDRRSWLRKNAEKYTGISMARNIKKALTKWLDWLKGKGQEVFDKTDRSEQLVQNYIDNLTDQEAIQFYDLKKQVMDTFLAGGPQNFTNPDARYKLDEEAENEMQSHKDSIDKKIKESSAISTADNNFEKEILLANQEENKIDNENDVLDDVTENYIQDELFNHDRLASLRKTSDVIKGFSNIYNKALRKNYVLNRDKNSKWNIPVFNGDDLMVDLYALAGNTNNAVDFIYELEKSENDKLFEFNRYMDLARNDKYSFLNSFWMLSKDVATVDSVQTYMSADGRVEIQSAMNMREKSVYDRNMENAINIYKNLNSFLGNKNNPTNIPSYLQQFYLSKYDKFNQSVQNLQKDQFRNEDIYNVIEFFGGDMNNFKDNSIFIDGRRRPLDAVTVALARSLGKNDTLYGTNGTKPEVIKYIRGLVVSNRNNTSDFTVQNAEGNQVPARQVKGHLNRKLEQMNRDARDPNMTERKFIDKYTKMKGKGLYSNGLLKYWYRSMNKGNDINVSQNLGIKNDKDGNYSDFSSNNSNDNSLNEFFGFLSSNNKGSYMMETGRYSDSPISYMMEVPTNNIDDFGKFNNGSFSFNTKQSSYFQYLGNVYNSLLHPDDRMSSADIKKELEKSIQREISGFMVNNSAAFKGVKSMSNYVDQNGNLNDLGKKAVASYVLNNWINGVQFNEIFLPDVAGKDRVKRAKGLRSPGYSFKGVQFEPIYFKDDLDQNGNEVDDSGMYILREDAERIQDAFGDVMPVGKGYKLLHAGMESMNPKWAGKNFFNKGYTTILDEEYVQNNPRLAGLYDAMKARREKYIKDFGPIDQALTSGNPTYMALAVPMSSNKIKGSNGELNVPSQFENEGAFTLDDYNDFGSDINSDIHKTFDEMYWDKGSFIGMDGENLILQQNMDKERHEVNTPVQMMKAIVTNGSVDGTLDKLENIQKLLSELEQEQLSETIDILLHGNSESVLELFKNSIDNDKIDNLQKYLLDDGLSINTPAVRSLAINTFLNNIRKNGNKLKTPGTIAQQKPAKFNKNVQYGNTRIPVYTNGTTELNFYSQRKDGTNRPGEAVVPNYLKGKLKTRQYRLFDASQNSELVEVAPPTSQIEIASAAKSYATGVMREAKSKNRIPQSMEIDEFINEYNVQNERGNIIGFYIPGETFLATRVPAHGPQSTGFFEAIDYDSTGASQVQLPTQFAMNITGGDYDGDQVFMQYKNSNNPGKWGEVFDQLQEHWLSKEMNREVTLPIDFEAEAKTAVANIKKKLPDTFMNKNSLMFTPEYRRKDFNDTLVSKNNVGAAANYHSYLGMISAYGTNFNKPISIDGKVANSFEDNAGESRTIASAKILNMILDNAKHGFADDLGINEHTIGDALILTNLGYSLEQIGTILNSDVFLNQVAKNAGKRNTFAAADTSEQLKTDGNIKISTKDINSKENIGGLESLIVYMSKIKSDVSDISSIMGGHNKIENDPFILSQQIENLETLLDNSKSDQVLNISDKLKENPMIQNYLKTAKAALEVQERFDPVSRKDFKDVYGNIIESSTRNINNNQKRKIHEDLERVATSRLLGLNNVSEEYKRGLTDPKSDNNIFARVQAIIDNMKSTVVSGDSIQNMLSEYDTSLLFSKVLSFSDGNKKYISLRSSFFNENLTDLERNMAVEEFSKLDGNLKKDLMIYDLMTNGWKGRKSLFHLMDKSFTKDVSKESDRDIKAKDRNQMSEYVKNQIEVLTAELNPNMFDSTSKSPFRRNPQGGLILDESIFNAAEGTANRRIWNKIRRGQPVSFIYSKKVGTDSNGRSQYQKHFIKFKGFTQEEKLQLKNAKVGFNSKEYFQKINEMMPSMQNNGSIQSTMIRDNFRGDLGYERLTSVADLTTEIPTDPFKLKKSEKENPTMSFLDWHKILSQKDDNSNDARFKLDDWYNYDERLDKAGFEKVMEFEPFVDNKTRGELYQSYLTDRRNAESLYKTINEESVKEMTEETLFGHFKDLGSKNKFAYSNVMKPIVMEIANRISQDQTQNYTSVLSDGKDISMMQKWFMSNNIPSNHPMVQGLVRNIENEYKNFGREKSEYQSRLQNVTNNLYKEQLGYLVSGGSLVDKVKALWDYLFTNKEELYSKLYGPIITYDTVTKKDKLGNNYQMKVMKYKTSEEIESGFKDGSISQAQYDFYQETKNIADELGKFGEYGKKGLRADYIPHVAPGQMEAFSRRGLLGLMVSSKTIDERIKDVKLDFTDPVSGKVMKNISFGDIDFMYSLATSQGGNKASVKEYYDLKLKAVKLLKKGINEDGTPIKLSEIDMGTVIGDTFMNRFTNSASQKSNHFQSLDLNKAFGDYIHTSLWTNGNDNFSGMKKLLPALDGVLATLDKNGQSKMSEYVNKVWRQNFLQGTKQRSIKTPAQLEALGVTSDKIVDYITRGSLVYWLGYKGMAIGGGLYAIGNILNGKFNNVAHAGGKNWLKGERRFWTGREGKFNLLDPFKGVKEANQILKKLGFMDINIYDDISVNQKNSLGTFFMNIALWPMSYSEKWIQGVHFLGMLTDDEWNAVLSDSKNPISSERINEIENKVKLSHGKGYQSTDQRMIQMYSWGRAMMQFSRHIPTVIYNNFGKKDIDNYGNVQVGAYRQVYDVIQNVVTGKVSPKEFGAYFKALSPEEQKKFKSGLMGFGILATAGALGTVGMDNKYVNDLASDVNIFFDTDRVGSKLSAPPALGMLEQLLIK